MESLGHLITLLILISLSPTSFSLFSRKEPASSSRSIIFSQENLIVRFSPYVSIDDRPDSYKPDDLLPMVTKIATTFSNVLAPRIGVWDKGDSHTHVAPAVANFNRRRGGRSKRGLKVFMAFELDATRPADDDRNGSLTTISFDMVLRVAEEANSKFAGTVDYLLLQQEELTESILEQDLRLLTIAKEKLGGKGNNSSKYKLGALFPFEACPGVSKDNDWENLASHLTSILGQFDIVVFHLWPGQREYFNGAEHTSRNFINEFQTCKENVAKLRLPLEVSFRTRWSDTDYSGKTNYSSLIHFWEEMGGWGSSTKTKMFLMDAFDNPFRGKRDQTEKSQGWWRLTGRTRNWSPDEDGFESKQDAERRSRGEKESSWEGISAGNIILVSVFVAGAILILTCTVIGVMYKRINNKIRLQQQSLLTKEERQLFFNGVRNVKSVPAVQSGSSPEGIIKSLEVIAYNKEYELEKKSFTIDETSLLGTGNFGVVFRGTVKKPDGQIPVAVKTLRSPCSPNTFKDLLSEVKTMSHLGHHDHVVSMVGAYTRELKKGIIYVFTEICERGSLLEHLKECVPRRYSDAPGIRMTSYLGNVEPESTSVRFSQVRHDRQKLTRELYRWSYEIASGMEFLASKHVVHADLATRNVLLTREMSAKISDFGLSRRMYDYQSYVKTQTGPLPWRSMAPESLCRSIFNEKTDVWGYGVTLWEIYSLGEQPYPGLTWTVDYASQLINGLRPGKPQYDADNMYDAIMLKCWRIDPDSRPHFRELRESFGIKQKGEVFASC